MMMMMMMMMMTMMMIIIIIIRRRIALRGAIRNFYNPLTAPQTASNTYVRVTRAKSCANYVQCIERL